LFARSIEQLERAKKEVEKYGGKSLIILCDVAYAKQVEATTEQTEKEFGPIDV
jgi:NADP-dependent 3-hydroxy acid dehydrogenase YdfG